MQRKGIYMNSSDIFYKKIRQQLRDIAKTVMSIESYSLYLDEENNWESRLNNTIVSLKSPDFSLPISTLSTEKTDSPTLSKDQNLEVPVVLQDPEQKNEEPPKSISTTNITTNIEDETSIEVPMNIKKEEVHLQPATQVHSTLKTCPEMPFHMSIQKSSTSKKRRRSIFRKKKDNSKKTTILQQAFATQQAQKQQDSTSFSHGVRNIISQIKTPLDEENNLEKREVLPVPESIEEQSKSSFIETISTITAQSTQEKHLETEDNILDVDILDLDDSLFQDLPPPIPDYSFEDNHPNEQQDRDQLLTEKTEKPNEHIQQETKILLQKNDVDSTKKSIQKETLLKKVDVSTKEEISSKDTIYSYTNLLLYCSKDEQPKIFLQRMSKHLIAKNWLLACSDASRVLDLDFAQKSEVQAVLQTHKIPKKYIQLITLLNT